MEPKQQNLLTYQIRNVKLGQSQFHNMSNITVPSELTCTSAKISSTLALQCRSKTPKARASTLCRGSPRRRSHHTRHRSIRPRRHSFLQQPRQATEAVAAAGGAWRAGRASCWRRNLSKTTRQGHTGPRTETTLTVASLHSSHWLTERTYATKWSPDTCATKPETV